VAVLQYALLIYLVGVVWGLIMIDARPVTRAAISLVWPLGPAAFVVTIVILVAAATIAFPTFAFVLLGALLAAAWALL
jgi:hypothetical protein